jgi:hypothetical protein
MTFLQEPTSCLCYEPRNLMHALTSYFFKTYFGIVLTTTLMSFQWLS